MKMFACKIFTYFFLLVLSFSGSESDAATERYIEEYKYVAIDEMNKSGIPASIILAQAIVESNAGMSNLARESNNHFGIKCKRSWTGETYYHVDDDRDRRGKLMKSCFRSYPTVEESYKDHSVFLVTRSHYNELFQYKKTDYVNWAHGLKRCGYATDEQYAHKLIRTIERFDLSEYDLYVVRYE